MSASFLNRMMKKGMLSHSINMGDDSDVPNVLDFGLIMRSLSCGGPSWTLPCQEGLVLPPTIFAHNNGGQTEKRFGLDSVATQKAHRQGHLSSFDRFGAQQGQLVLEPELRA